MVFQNHALSGKLIQPGRVSRITRIAADQVADVVAMDKHYVRKLRGDSILHAWRGQVQSILPAIDSRALAWVINSDRARIGFPLTYVPGPHLHNCGVRYEIGEAWDFLHGAVLLRWADFIALASAFAIVPAGYLGWTLIGLAGVYLASNLVATFAATGRFPTNPPLILVALSDVPHFGVALFILGDQGGSVSGWCFAMLVNVLWFRKPVDYGYIGLVVASRLGAAADWPAESLAQVVPTIIDTVLIFAVGMAVPSVAERGVRLRAELSRSKDSLSETLSRLEESLEARISSEKLATFGHMATYVANKINNKLTSATV